MKKHIYLPLFACLSFTGVSLVRADTTIELVDTFRYAGGNAVLTLQLNDSNAIVGTTNLGKAVKGFSINASGRVSAPFHEPLDTTNYTVATGLNNRRAICGYYDDGVSTKGFLKFGETYSSYVAPVNGDVTSTVIYSINDAGSFVGSYTTVANVTAKPFAVVHGVFTTIPIPGALEEARGINNLNQIVGDYSYLDVGEGLFYHGYFLNHNGNLFNVDFPGAKRTIPMAINDDGYIVGSWFDGTATHGFVVVPRPPVTFISYDVPGATKTVLTGINNNGMICGTYSDADKPYGFLAQIQSDQ